MPNPPGRRAGPFGGLDLERGSQAPDVLAPIAIQMVEQSGDGEFVRGTALALAR